MQDQASQLRQWVRQQADLQASSGIRGPGLVVVLGGRPGVGATTVSANLAAALSTAGIRTILFDGDLRSADATRLCRIHQAETLADVVCAGRTLPDILRPGPAGIYVVPGIRPGQKFPSDSRYAAQRIVDGLRGLGSCAEMVVADLGGELYPWTKALWRTAQCLLAVTTSDPAVLMDTYAVLKTLTTQAGLTRVRLVVNRVASEAEAKDVYERLSRTCLRFLALPVSLAGFFPADDQVQTAGKDQGLPVTWTPLPEFASRIHQVAHYVAEILGKRKGPWKPPHCSSLREESEAGEGGSPPQPRLRGEPPWDPGFAVPPQWHLSQGDWAGKLGFPITVSPRLDSPAGENRKKV